MPIASRTFRVFVSSTFEDLIEERNALQREVFPALSKLCQAHGARFQAIDLRWGVRDEAVLGQKMMEICLAEIERCQRTRIKPNFIVLLGDRYGKPPLPARVQAQEFEALLSCGNSDANRALMESWYQRDDNAVPAEYLLKPRTGELVDANRWKDIEEPLGEALRKAARAAGLAPGALLKYEGSASHQEIVKGLGTTSEDRRHTFAFLRRTDGAEEPPKLKELKSFLKAQLGENAVEYSSGDIGSLCRDVCARLSKVILDEVSRFESRTALDLEVEAHDRFVHDCASHFTGRNSILQEVADYVASRDLRPLVLHGASGSGKSAIMAKASEPVSQSWWRRALAVLAGVGTTSGPVVVRRFIGISPESSDGLTLLRGVCHQICQRYNHPGEVSGTFDDLATTIPEKLALATPKRPLILFIDALDQLEPEDPARAMSWLPPELPPNCKVVLSTADVPTTLRAARLLQVEPFPEREAKQALVSWLGAAHRTLQPEQTLALLACFRRCPSPLYLKLAFEAARRWRSFDRPDECVLSEGLTGITDMLFGRLSLDHSPMLVSRSLGYLTAARYGLTEDEMLAILTQDKEVWKDFLAGAHHQPPERRLPVVVWSRLYLDLEPYLTERTGVGGNLISYYHRHLAEVARARFLEGTRAAGAALRPLGRWRAHRLLANFFGREANPQRSSEWSGPPRCLTELPYHLHASGLDKGRNSLARLWKSIPYLDARVAHTDVHDLIQEYRWVPQPNELIRELHDLLMEHAQRLEKHRTLFFSLIHHEGSNLLRERCDEAARTGRSRRPWILTKSVWLPPLAAQPAQSVSVASSFRFATSAATMIGSPVSLVLFTKRLGQIGYARLPTGREYPRSLICRPRRVLKLCASPNGRRLAVAYEDGNADLIATLFAADGSLVEQYTVADFRFLIPEVEEPFLTWGDDRLLYQREDGGLGLLRSSGEAELFAVPEHCRGELSGAVFENGRWLATIRQGLDTWILAYFKGEEPSFVCRPGSDVTTIATAGRQMVAIGFSDNHLLLLRAEGPISVERAIECRTRPVCAAGNGDSVLFVESNADAYSWDLQDGRAPMRLEVTGAFSTVGAAAVYFERPIQMVLNHDNSAWVLTNSGVYSLDAPRASAPDYSVYQVLGGAAEALYSIQQRGDDYWVADSRRRRECYVARGRARRQYFSVNGRDEFLAAADSGGAVCTDLETLQFAELPDTPFALNSVAPEGEGFWLADRFGGIFYLGPDRSCNKVAHIELSSLTGATLYSWPGGLLWRGNSLEKSERGDSCLHLVFFSIPARIPLPLDPVGRRMFPKREGQFQAVCYDAATEELILILVTPQGGICARIGTVAEFLAREETPFALDCSGPVTHAAVSRPDNAVYLLSGATVRMLDRNTLQTRAVLACSGGFDWLNGSLLGGGPIAVVESGKRVFTCEGGELS